MSLQTRKTFVVAQNEFAQIRFHVVNCRSDYLNMIGFQSSSEHRLRYFWWNLSWTTEMFKAQKRSKDIVKIVHVKSVVQP